MRVGNFDRPAENGLAAPHHAQGVGIYLQGQAHYNSDLPRATVKDDNYCSFVVPSSNPLRPGNGPEVHPSRLDYKLIRGDLSCAQYQNMDSSDLREEPFPAPSKQAVGLIDGVETQASSTFFSDKIMVTLSQEGRLSQWVG